MPRILDLGWDSAVLGLRAGRVEDLTQPIDADDLAGFDYVHARVSQSDVAATWSLEAVGFQFVTVDYGLTKVASAIRPLSNAFQLVRVSRSIPFFSVTGFEVQGSRFFIDSRLRSRLPAEFWDSMILEHCREFADFVIGAVASDGALVGCVTCFETPRSIDMFLVVVHPEYQGRGIGKLLLAEVEAEATARGKTLTTSVVSHNLAAMNFYLKNGFAFSEAFSVLHMVR